MQFDGIIIEAANALTLIHTHSRPRYLSSPSSSGEPDLLIWQLLLLVDAYSRRGGVGGVAVGRVDVLTSLLRLLSVSCSDSRAQWSVLNYSPEALRRLYSLEEKAIGGVSGEGITVIYTYIFIHAKFLMQL
jgi:hypothetical protein